MVLTVFSVEVVRFVRHRTPFSPKQEKSTTVDQEIKKPELKHHTAITGAHRQTIASRLKGVKPQVGTVVT